MSENLKTIKELADEFNVSKQAVRKRLTEEFRANHVETVTSNGVKTLVVTYTGYMLLKKHFTTSNTTGNDKVTDTSNPTNADLSVVKILEQQLFVKDKQLENKDSQISQMQNLLDQQQRLALQDKKLLEEYKAENDSLKALKMPTQETEFKHLDNQYKDEVNALKEKLENLQEQIKVQKKDRRTRKTKKMVGTMAKIDDSVKKKVPELRFKGFTNDWEERKLGELASFSKGNGYTKNDLVEFGDPIILYGRLYTKYETVIEKVDTFVNKKDNSIISEGSEVIVPASGESSEDISRASVVGKSGLILGGDLNIIKPVNYIDSIFLALTISNGSQRQEMSKRAQGKSVVHLHNSDLKQVNLLYPKLEEQQKIGTFFKQLDCAIALHQHKLDLLKEQKKGYLQKMFPKNGAKVPELRFAGFADDWEERKFKDILKTHSFRSYLAGVSENGEYEVIQQGDKPIIGYSDGEPFTDYKDVTLFGDHTVSLYKPQSPFFVATDGVKILSADNFEGNYLYTTLERYKPEPQGYKRHFTILKNQDVWFTENMEEQQKIGSFFKQLDETIDLHQHKLDLLKEQKKGFLQKMFV